MYCKIEAAKYRRAVAGWVVSKHDGNSYRNKNMRLREYAEYFYLATGCKPLDRLSVETMTSTIEKIHRLDSSTEYQIIRLVFDALLSSLNGGDHVHFQGCEIECVCGGSFNLDKERWRYHCETCELEGRADNVGLPCSLPASTEVRQMRNTVHRRIDSVLNGSGLNISFDELYKMVAFLTHIPLPYMHIGWMTTMTELNSVMSALSEVESVLGEKNHELC